MPPVNRKSPSPVRRRPAVAGVRTPGADRDTRVDTKADYDSASAPQDSASQDAAGSDAAGSDAAGSDAAGSDAAGSDAAGSDAAGSDAAGSDAAGSDAAEGGSARRGSALSLLKRPARAESAVRPPSGEDRGSGAGGSRRAPLLPISLGLAALLLVAAVVLAAVAWSHASTPANSAASSNAALIDAPATQQAGAAAVDILQKAYSYTYTTIDANLDAAVAVMKPEMGAKHRANFDTIRKTVTNAKTTTKASVIADGVRLLSGDRAEVLAFVVVTGDNGGTAFQPSGYRLPRVCCGSTASGCFRTSPSPERADA